MDKTVFILLVTPGLTTGDCVTWVSNFNYYITFDWEYTVGTHLLGGHSPPWNKTKLNSIWLCVLMYHRIRTLLMIQWLSQSGYISRMITYMAIGVLWGMVWDEREVTCKLYEISKKMADWALILSTIRGRVARHPPSTIVQKAKQRFTNLRTNWLKFMHSHSCC